MSKELQLLERQAMGLDAEIQAENTYTEGPEGTPGPDMGQEAPSQADELGGIIMTVGGLLAMRWPSLARVYTQEKCNAAGAALAPAFEKLGWNLTGGESMVYLNALGAVVILGLETRAAIQADNQAEAVKRASEGTPDVVGNPPSAPNDLSVNPQVALYQ